MSKLSRTRPQRPMYESCLEVLGPIPHFIDGCAANGPRRQHFTRQIRASAGRLGVLGSVRTNTARNSRPNRGGNLF